MKHIDLNVLELDDVQNYTIDYSIITLVSNENLYQRMLDSFLQAGFEKGRAEFIYADNTGSNKTDGFSGLNRLLSACNGRYVIAAHQDIIVNDSISILDILLEQLSNEQPQWAIAGNAGYDTNNKSHLNLTDRHILPGARKTEFPLVQSLDENLIIIRRDANIGWSNDLSGYHLYGTDIVQQSRLRGFSSHVIDYRVEHTGAGKVDTHFINSVNHFQDKYLKALRPRSIKTTVTWLGLGRKSPYVRKRQASLVGKIRQESSGSRMIFNLTEDFKDTIYRIARNGRYNINGISFNIGRMGTRAARKALRRGKYELPERQLMEKWLPKDLPVIELGGSYGIISSIARRHILPEHPLIVVEANPELISICKENIAAGGGKGFVRVINAALAYCDAGIVNFIVTEGIHTSHVARNGQEINSIPVKAITLQDLINSENIDGDYGLICDIEGYEYDLIENEPSAIRKAKIIIMELHMAEFYERKGTTTSLLSKMDSYGFERIASQGTVVVFKRRDRVKELSGSVT